MEQQDFGERLKAYRRAKNMTQQDLADRLGVSNKTVSRWESGGGWPDPPLLVPLARCLGVTVDDLMDGEKPIRSLTQADWQGLLSFVFALGGGALYFLGKLFMPVPLCYLAYLACMAYGLYLQKYYCYQSRWFRLGNLVMDFSVNLSLSGAALSGLYAFSLGLLRQEDAALSLLNWGGRLWMLTAAAVILAALLTALTLAVAAKRGYGGPTVPRLDLHVPTPRDLVPVLGALVLGGFWAVFTSDELPLWVYLNQAKLYFGLLALLVLACVLLSCRKGRRWGLLSAGALALGGCALPQFTQRWAYLPYSQNFMQETAEMAERYPRFGRFTTAVLVAALALAALCLLLSILRIKTLPREPKQAEKERGS